MIRTFADRRALRTSLLPTKPQHSTWLSSRSGRVRIALMVLALAAPGQSWANGATCPGFAAAVLHNSGASNPFSVTIGDVSGDGKPDLVVANYGSQTCRSCWGAGTVSSRRRSPTASASARVQRRSADVNGDGKPDLAVVNEGTRAPCQSCWGTANGTFAGAVGYGAGDTRVRWRLGTSTVTASPTSRSRTPMPTPSRSYWGTGTARSPPRLTTPRHQPRVSGAWGRQRRR